MAKSTDDRPSHGAVTISQESVTLTIDGTEVSVPRGTSVLNAARSLRLHVPTLCDHPTLESVGACRMCVVEIQPGPPRPTASCTTPAADGMEVRTDTQAIVDIRRKTIEMLLQHHPLDCPYCDQSGTCELQDETFGLNIWKSPFETVSKAYPEENLNEVVMINHNRCILCYRCVRVCDEQMGVHALDVSDRGGRSFIVTAQHKFMDCERCGMCIEVCPVGAVLSRPFKHSARAWQTVRADSTCPHCSVGCKIQVESRKGEVLRVRVGEPVEPNRGIVCVKGFFGWSFVNDDQRIGSPMIRRAGELEEVEWREAIEFVSEHLTAIAEIEGPETIGAVGSGRYTNEDNYALQRLMRSVVGTNNVYLAA
ncbi:MAG: 2Fe-2S iron-sulfur cluster-binding protein, partial [Gammaproteobacteria bacterium]|nr:2Fe-2S iron-sulfur cluster-binding protein [Gammaproteobacteria bacterium]